MGASKSNSRSNDYRGAPGPNYGVAFKVIHAPSQSWVDANKAAIEAGTAAQPPEADMRIGVMLCILEQVKSPLKMVPDKTMIRPCAVVFSESMEAFKANTYTPEELEAYLAQQVFQPIVEGATIGAPPIPGQPDQE